MEVLMKNLIEQELVSLDNVELKIEHKVVLPENAKKLIALLQERKQIIINENPAITCLYRKYINNYLYISKAGLIFLI